MRMLSRLWRQSPRVAGYPGSVTLDTPLIYFSPHDLLTVRASFEHMHFFGQTGAGKTSASRHLALPMLRAGYGGLILCFHEGERALWQEDYCRITGRTGDLVIVSPDHPHKFNWLNYEMQRDGGGQTENLVNMIGHIADIVEGEQELKTGEKFWGESALVLARQAITILKLSQGTVSLKDIDRLITTAPRDEDQPKDDDWWTRSFCAHCIEQASVRPKTEQEQHDYDMAEAYWLEKFAGMADRTRSSIEAHLTSITNQLLHGLPHTLLGTETTLSPEIAYTHRKIILLDLPLPQHGQVGRIVQSVWKYMFERCLLRRNLKTHPIPCFIWADEASNFVSSYDFYFLSTARQHGVSVVYLSQNINQYYAVLGSSGRYNANALLGNFGLKIAHANTDPDTNQYMAEMIGRELIYLDNHHYNAGGQGSMFGGGASAHYEYKVQPAAFTQLRTGGPQNNRIVEAIVFRGGKPWNATGDNWLKAAFKQPKLD